MTYLLLHFLKETMLKFSMDAKTDSTTSNDANAEANCVRLDAVELLLMAKTAAGHNIMIWTSRKCFACFSKCKCKS